MANKVEICNLALGNIKASSINSLDEASLSAQVCTQRFDQAVKFVLRDHPWRFARKTDPLSLLALTPLEWTYAYDYPKDCVSMLYLRPNATIASDRTVAYRFENFENWESDYRLSTMPEWELGQSADGDRTILTNQAEAYGVYTAEQTNPTRFDPAFVEALSWYLSAMIAIPIVGAEKGRDLRTDAMQVYQQALPAAMAHDANEQSGTVRAPESPSILVRN